MDISLLLEELLHFLAIITLSVATYVLGKSISFISPLRCQWQRAVFHLLHLRGLSDRGSPDRNLSSPGVCSWQRPGSQWRGWWSFVCVHINLYGISYRTAIKKNLKKKKSKITADTIPNCYSFAKPWILAGASHHTKLPPVGKLSFHCCQSADVVILKTVPSQMCDWLWQGIDLASAAALRKDRLMKYAGDLLTFSAFNFLRLLQVVVWQKTIVT